MDPVVMHDVGLGGPARPRTAAASPLAMMVANPNFFILVPSSWLFLSVFCADLIL